MADTSLTPILVGGGLAMLGGAITAGIAFLASWLGRAEEKRNRRAEKFEELVSAVYEFDDWIGKNKNHTVFGETQTLGPSPFAKIEAITAIHFKEFKDQVSELSLESSRYLKWMPDAGMRRLQGKISEINDGAMDVYKPYLAKREALLKALVKFGREKF
jgi:hypothetical protein